MSFICWLYVIHILVVCHSYIVFNVIHILFICCLYVICTLFLVVHISFIGCWFVVGLFLICRLYSIRMLFILLNLCQMQCMCSFTPKYLFIPRPHVHMSTSPHVHMCPVSILRVQYITILDPWLETHLCPDHLLSSNPEPVHRQKCWLLQFAN